MEKTLEIHLAEQREAIAKQVEAMRCECDPVDDSLKCVEENFLYDEIAKEIRKG